VRPPSGREDTGDRRLRIALETQFAYGRGTGLGTYAANVAAALRERGDVELCELCSPNVDVWRFDRRIFWDQIAAPAAARRCKADVTHFTGGTLPLFAPHPCVLTVHDCAWLGGAAAGRFYSKLYFADLQRRFVRKAQRLVTDTQTTRNEIAERLRIDPEQVAVVGAGVDEAWFGLQRAPADPPYVLAVGTVEARKDLETAVRAIALLQPVRLVSAGVHTAYANRVRRTIARLGLEGRVELRGYVDAQELKMLYRGASALIFPSKYEGFGLPPLQALAARLPVVASDIPVLREVLEDCALFAQPGNVEDFAACIQRVLAHPASLQPLIERGQTRARGFTWSSVAQRLVRVYRSLL
jgi:glycosyltransferase involved in cell wall biosynthesis